MKNKVNNWLQNLLMGRNGSDQLSMALLLLSLVISLIANGLKQPIISYFGLIPLIFAIFRIFSKSVQKRRMENYKFMMLISPLYSWFTKTSNRIKDRKSHKYLKCPNCKQTLRLPKGKGKVSITCSKCKTKFIKKI